MYLFLGMLFNLLQIHCNAKKRGSKAENNVLSILTTLATSTNILMVLPCYLFNCS